VNRFERCFRLTGRCGYTELQPVASEEELREALRWSTVIELAPEQLARYRAYIDEGIYWERLFSQADVADGNYRQNGGWTDAELEELARKERA